jgi:hypothetical protein
VTPPATSLLRWHRRLFVALIALLPLHTVFIDAWVAWKPWLVLVAVLGVLDLLVAKGYPWSRRLTLALIVFVLAVAASWPGARVKPTFFSLLLGLCAGGLLMLVVARNAANRMALVLRTVYWSAAVMGLTGLLVALASNGTFGFWAVFGLNDLPLVFRVNRPAYLTSGFITVTNWHQDPGYAAAWTNLWLALSIVAVGRRLGSKRYWLNAAVIGALAASSVLTYSRTGWLGLLVGAVTGTYAARRENREQGRRALRVMAGGVVMGLVMLTAIAMVDRPRLGGDVLYSLNYRTNYLFDITGGADFVDPSLIVSDNRRDVWGYYFRRFADSPWRGIGLGTGWGTPGLQEPHNLVIELLGEAGILGLAGFLVLATTVARNGGGPVGGTALVLALLPSMTQTVLFEPTWWLAAGLWVAGKVPGPVEPEVEMVTGVAS